MTGGSVKIKIALGTDGRQESRAPAKRNCKICRSERLWRVITRNAHIIITFTLKFPEEYERF